MSTVPRPPTVRVIHTNNPEREVWNVIRGFGSEHFVTHFAKDRISNSFHGLPLSSVNAKKQAYNTSTPKPKTPAQILQPLQVTDIPTITTEVANNAIQAIDFYSASQSLPLLSRPILLHYAFEKLMNVLTLLTFEVTSPNYSHGLTFYPEKPIAIKLNGSFERFHDCYSAEPDIYLNSCSFTFDSILNAGQIYDEELIEAIHQNTHNALNARDTKTGNSVHIFELDREFLFVFAVSTLARYRVKEWSEIVAGKTSSDIVRIERYLQSVQMVFPNLIINQLYGVNFMFFPYFRVS